MIYRKYDEADNDCCLKYYRRSPQLVSEMAPYSLLALRKEPYCAERAYGYGLCFHRGYLERELYHGCPIGDWDHADWKEIFREAFPRGTVFLWIPELLMRKWKGILGDAIEVEETREDWDYILDTSKISELKGSGLKSFRHKYHSFLRNYSCAEEKLSPELFDAIRSFHDIQTEQLRRRTSVIDTIDLDDATFHAALDLWDDRHLYGTVFRIDGKIVGALINEIIDERNVIGLYQRQDRRYAGLAEYMIITDCTTLMKQGYRFYNIMTDAGSTGLRAFKLHSQPMMLKKYTVIMK